MALKSTIKITQHGAIKYIESTKGMCIKNTLTGRLYKHVSVRIPTKNRYKETDIPIPVKEYKTKEKTTQEE